jgi:mono/diheme cytochrome c family protein
MLRSGSTTFALTVLLLLVVRPAWADEAAEGMTAGQATPEGLEFFEKHIRPVLTQHCYKCHSADSQPIQGDFVLDTREAIRRGGPSGPAVVPGDPEAGELIPALRHESYEMPPTGKLSDAEIGRFVEWIKMGAPDPRDGTAAVAENLDLAEARKRWPYQAPEAVEPPEVKDSAWPRGAIDRFVLARLEAEGLRPVDPATKRQLIRRATFDLIGLPPSPEDVANFLADESPDAFARVIDRLLASPHHGERWARHWLDVARYAEDQAHTFGVRKNTNGYQYRDWVIEAFNRDLPYDKFVTYQIAADLVDQGKIENRDELRALGFFGLGAVYYKNSDKAKAEADELDDRVDTLSRGFLGLTVSCARCHDHKFDPIPTQDYYSLAGVFHSCRLTDIPLADADEVAEYNAAQKSVKEAETHLAEFVKSHKARLAEKQSDTVARYLVAAWKHRANQERGGIKELAAAEGLEEQVLDRWIRLLSGKSPFATLESWSALEAPASVDDAVPAAVAELAEEVQRSVRILIDRRDGVVSDDTPKTKSEALFTSRTVTKEQPWADIDVDLTGARELYLSINDGGNGNSCDWADWIEPRLIGPAGEIKLTKLNWRTASAGSGQVNVNRNAGGQPLRVGGQEFTDGIGSHATSLIVYDLPKGITRFRARGALDDAGSGQGGCGASASVQFVVSTSPIRDLPGQSEAAKKLTDDEKKFLDTLFGERGVYQRSDRELEAELGDALRQELLALRATVEQRKSELPPMYPVAHGIADNRPTDLKIYVRGNPAKQGDVAPRRFLRVIAGDEPEPFTQGSGRLELAQAIATDENPLTARVIVNRVWQQHFGRGIVNTPSNFGSLGDPPTHPELLDWLAVRFVENGWSLKWLHREIMLSATYQLSSQKRAENDAIDPENRWLWRANRRRLEVEPWRDALLAVSGQLDPTLGGPSLDLNSNENNRRTVYSSVSRHELAQLLRLFDFPDANVTNGRRNQTTVPQQQLFVLNSPFMLRQAESLVKRLEAQAKDDADRIRFAYELLYGRPAGEREVELGLAFLSAAQEDRDPADRLNSWVQYAQVLLSANEFMYFD